MRTVFQLLLVLLPVSLFAQKVKWENTTVNFGTVKDWNSPAATFTFKNVGNERLMFLPQRHNRKVLVRYPSRAFRPGESGTIEILYYTGETGAFSETIEIYSNASNKAEKLTVKGNIKSIYANALTQCPSFQTTTPQKKGEPNVVQAIDALTNRPIPGTQIEIFDRGVRKSINGTNLDGVAVNWIEPGNYITVAFKDGYEKAEEEVTFTKRNRSHVVYLNRKSSREEPITIQEPQVAEEFEEPLDLGITTNKVLEQESSGEELDASAALSTSLGISTNNQWEEPEEISEEMDLGVSLNDQLEEETENQLTVESLQLPEEVEETVQQTEGKLTEEPIETTAELTTDLGITTNQVLEEENREAEIEQMVESALAEAEVEPEPVKEVVPTIESEFAETSFKPNNVLLLLDVSGSMRDEGKMEKLKSSINRMVRMLREVDVLTMIAYNSDSWELLPPTPVTDNESIVAMIDSLKAFGYTNGVKGMESAYASLEKQLIEDGNNQLIIATDGKFNSSKFSEKDAIQLVKSNRDKGIVLSIIGFGDDREAGRLMKKLADLGEGSFLKVKTNEDPTELLAEEIKLRSRK